MRRLWLIAIPVVAFVIGLPGPATAAPGTITLSASQTEVVFGQSTMLFGAVAPAPLPSSTVEIVDAAIPTTVLATATTDGAGQYSVDFVPQANVDVQARFATDLSPPVGLRVRPRLTAHLDGVRLFGTASVSGHLDPAHPGQKVEVAMLQGDKVVARRDALLSGSGEYEAEVEILKSGRYRARVSFSDPDHLPVEETSDRKKVGTPPKLHPGSNGAWVEVLEERLDQLQYHLPGPNRHYDNRTGDAVLAFHKVQGMQRVRSVGGATWKRLADPRRPQPRAKEPPNHIEIDQSKQVIYVVRQGEVDDIVHTSTGAGGATRDGVFHVHRKIAGFSPHRLYYPSYFDGNRAVHGWPEVPTYPASHGCSRVPYWAAKFLFNVMHYGMEVRVYH